MKVEEVRELLKKACDQAGSQIAWAEAHGVHTSYVSDVINGRKDPGAKILNALGLDRTTIYTPRGSIPCECATAA